MSSSTSTRPSAPDPAALAQGYRALARSRGWAIASIAAALLTLGAYARLDTDQDFLLFINLFVVLAAAASMLIRVGPIPTRTKRDHVPTLPSPAMLELVELLERACERLERGQDAVFDTLYMDYIYDDGLDARGREWLDAHGVPRERIFDVASNWAEADDPDNPELRRAIHREVSLILAAILDRECEDPYRASVRLDSLADLLGLTWLRTNASTRDAELRHDRVRGRRFVRWIMLACVAVAVFAMFERTSIPLDICIPGVHRCRFPPLRQADLEFAAAVLLALLPFVFWSASAAQRFIARRSFAVALPVRRAPP